MEFDETRWREIQGLASFPGTSAPKAVVVALNSIIDTSVSAAVWPSMDTTASTTAWKCWAVTERSVGYVLIRYKKADYDEREERQKELTPSNWSGRLLTSSGFGTGPSTRPTTTRPCFIRPNPSRSSSVMAQLAFQPVPFRSTNAQT